VRQDRVAQPLDPELHGVGDAARDVDEVRVVGDVVADQCADRGDHVDGEVHRRAGLQARHVLEDGAVGLESRGGQDDVHLPGHGDAVAGGRRGAGDAQRLLDERLAVHRHAPGSRVRISGSR
jgi:hypothetical protein